MPLSENEIEGLYDSRFYKEWHLKIINVEGKSISLSYYILTMCIEDLDLFVRQGKRPYRSWRIWPIYEYFNIKGHKRESAKKLLQKLNELKRKCDNEYI